ncbi:MAG: PAS domain S-box protein [Nitrospirae bacterium]|nr:PAS domain S-box protein [Nitrospirota bacterium]MDA1305125.1 PAS domain S-box protein [Nitrospirota bacterium]
MAKRVLDTSSQSTREHFHDIFVTSSEVPNSEQATHILRAQKLILEKIVQNHDLPSTLETLCLQFENILSPAICVIRLSDSQTGLMQIKVSPNMPENLRVDLEKFSSEDYLDSGNSADLPQKVVILPVRNEDPIRKKTKDFGIQSYWSIPFATKLSNPSGAFTVLHQKLRHPSTFDLYAIETAAHLAGLALQRHEEERELHANKERLQDLFDSAPVAYFTSSMDGKIISANTCAAELTGLSKEALTGQSVIELFSPTLRGRTKAERIHKWINHGLEVEGEELELERPDGSRRWVSLTVRLIRDSMGTPIERRGILEDISHRKQTEHLLAEQKTILEMIAKGQPLHHTLSRLCQGIEIASPEMQCSIHQLEGTKLQYLAAPSLPKAYTTKIASIEIGPAAGSCGTAAYRHEPVIVSDIATDPLWNKGRALALRHGLQACWSIPISSSTNEVLGTIAMYYPTPRTPSREDWEVIESSTKLAGIALEQDRDRAALKQSEARYRTLYDDNPSMYFTIALDGTVRSVNYFGASQLGFTTGELLGTSVFSLCHLDDRSDVRRRVHSYLQAPTDLENLEFRQIRKDRSIIWVQVSMRLVKSSDQESVLLLVSENVTTQKQIKETLVASEHAIRKLYDITSSPNLDFEERIRGLLHLGCERFNLPIGLLTHCTEKDLIVKFVQSPSPCISEGTLLPLQDTFCHETMKAGEPLGFERASETVWKTHLGYASLGWECYLGTKVIVGQDTYGTLCFGNQQAFEGTFSEADKDFLQLMSKWIGTELERNRAEDALRRSEGRLRQVIDLVPHFIFAKDSTGRFILANQAVAEVYGTTAQNLIGKTDNDFSRAPQEVDHFREHDLEVLETGEAKTIEECITDAQGHIRHLYTIKIPFVFANSALPAILGVAIDITDRKKGEDALRLTQHVFDILPDHVAVVGPDYRYRRVNKVYEQVHGMPATDILGKHISDLLGKQNFLRDIKPNFDRCLAGEIVSFERWFHFRDGQDRFMAVTYSPLREKGKPHCIEAVVVNSRDLTLRKHMEETLKNNEEHLRILLDERIRISQDLHDHVLQSIYAVGLIIAAIRKPLETKNFSEVYEFLEQAVQQVNNSIVDIRGFIEGLPQADLDSGDFETELTHLVQSMTIPDGPAFTIRVDQTAIDLLSNRNTVHLINIARESMSNCLRHAKATKGSITFTQKNGNLQFEIRDNGVGFHQGDCSHSGHGLVNMNARATQLHGTLTIRSAPNKGTRVIIHIPINTSTQGK